MSLSIYLYFDGNCGEAFDHYKAVFDAVEECRETYGDAPDGTFDNDDPGRIMHATLRIGDAMLMGADRVTSSRQPVNIGDNFCVHFRPESKSQADRIFSQLAEAGNISMPLSDTFWGSYFGMCTDRFGVHWKFNLPLQ